MSEVLPSCLENYRRANSKINLVSGIDRLYYVNGLKDICTALEGFLKYKKYTGSNKDKMKKFASDFKTDFEDWGKTDLFDESMEVLLSESPVENMDNGKIFSLNGKGNLEEIFKSGFFEEALKYLEKTKEEKGNARL